MKFFKRGILIFLLMLTSMLNVQAQNMNMVNQREIMKMAIEGTSEIRVKPDRVTLVVGFSERSTDLRAAKNKMSDTIQNLVAYAKSRGVKENHIQTAFIDIRPEPLNYNSSMKAAAKQETYYLLNQSLSITLEDVNQYSEFIFDILDRGVNVVSAIRFTSSLEQELQKEALQKAIVNAKTKAVLLTDTAGVKLGKIVNIEEVYSYQPMYENAALSVSDYRGAAEGSSSIAAPGEITIRSTVRLIYEVGE